MKKIYYIMMLFAGLWILSCEEEKIGQTPTDNMPPSRLLDVQVEEQPGGAKFTYQLPNETDIAYVKAEFMFQGKKRVVRSSIYDNFLIVEGLGSIDSVTVDLFLVDHSENASEPVRKTFVPKTPPIQSILESVNIEPDFGGVRVKWENPLTIEIAVTVFATDSLGKLTEGETTFSNSLEGDYSFIGYDDSTRLYAIRIIDKWNNISDTAKKTVTPYYSILLDRTKHTEGRLPEDNTTVYSNSTLFSKLFDGNINANSLWHTAEGTLYTMPQYFTVDLGDTAVLNRFVVWERGWEGTNVFYYRHHNPKSFAVWGALDLGTHLNSYWKEEWKSDWEFLGDYEIVQPSGDGAVTPDDISVAEKGFSFYFPPMEKVRYLRFMVKNTFSGSNTIHLCELQFYGNNRKN